MPIEHIIVEVGRAIVHLYTILPGLCQRLDEAKHRGQPLTGVYTYRKDKPPPKGKYHLHVFEKNNELFAINWDGTAHDKSHNKVIPLHVYDALRERFPDLKLPKRDSRVIESVNPQSSVEPVESASSRNVPPDELLVLKALIETESNECPTINCEPYSKVQFFYGRYILWCGQPLLIAAAQHGDDGGVNGEAQLFWFPPGLQGVSKQKFRRTTQANDGPTVGDLLGAGREWAVGQVALEVQACWSKAGKTETPPPAEFTDGTVFDVLRLWMFGRAKQPLQEFIELRDEDVRPPTLWPAAHALRFNLTNVVNFCSAQTWEVVRRLCYLGPLRQVPSRYFSEIVNEQVIQSVAAPSWTRLASRPGLVEDVNRWLKDTLGTPYSVEICRLRDNTGTERALFPEFLDGQSKITLSHRDLGFGMSQVIPLLIEAAARENGLVAVEQPELHLHPAQQAELGDVFIESALGERKNTFLLETHSEHLILRIMRRIRETQAGKLPAHLPQIRPEDVSVLYVERVGSSSIVREFPLNSRGELVKAWPGGFFEESLNELL